VRSPVVLYDADCGFCRAVLAGLLALDRRRRLRPVALQSAEGERLLPGETEEERLAALHFAVPGQTPVAGGAAVSALLSELPGGRPLARLLDRLPAATERAYRLVADNRSTLSRAVPAAAKRRADAALARRVAE
jgi:predicted DCC family thiol-disulfide oxidoreductase YuxK